MENYKLHPGAENFIEITRKQKIGRTGVNFVLVFEVRCD